MIKIPFILSFFFLLLFSNLQSQAVKEDDSLVLFKQSETFMRSKPFAQYNIEIRNDRTISFYGFLPENCPNYHHHIAEKCAIDSCIIILDSLDYFTFEQAILNIDLENPDSHLKKKLVENRIHATLMTSYGKTYLIKTSQHSIVYSIGGVMERDLSEAFVNINKLIKELEKKYRPK